MGKLHVHLVFAFALLMLLNPISGQSPNSFIEEVCGVEWIGHYQNSEDSNLVHILRWKIEYNGQMARALKSVPELDFFMETNIFFDYDQDRFASLSLLNKAMISKGLVTGDEKHLKIQGKSYFQDGSREFRIEYLLNAEGQLEDRFFRKTDDGEWTQGHFILYKRKSMQADD